MFVVDETLLFEQAVTGAQNRGMSTLSAIQEVGNVTHRRKHSLGWKVRPMGVGKITR